MKFLSYIKVELFRLLKSKITWAVYFIMILSPIAGLNFYRPLESVNLEKYVTTTLGTYVANPALAAGLIGIVLFAIYTLYELNRKRSNRTDVFIDTIISPLQSAIAYLISFIIVAFIGSLITAIIWLPFTILKTSDVFELSVYINSYFLFLFTALPLSILFVAASYQLTNRFDLSLVIFIVFLVLSLTVFRVKWLLCWANPCIWSISDDFSNIRLFKYVFYMRLGWFVFLLGIWALSYCFIRRYEKGLFLSFFINSKKVYRPIISIVLVIVSIFMYKNQPFVDDSEREYNFEEYYNIDYSDDIFYTSQKISVKPDTKNGTVSGKVIYQLKNTSGSEGEISFFINPGYKFSKVTANGRKVKYKISDKTEINTKVAKIFIPKDEKVKLEIEYDGFPKIWNLIETMQGDPEISEKYMSLENEVLAPVARDFMEFDNEVKHILDIVLPNHMTPILFGTEEPKLLSENSDGTKKWRFETKRSVSKIFAGDYICEKIEAANLKVKFYYGRKHKDIMDSLGAKDVVKNVIEYCTEKYGPLEFYSDGKLKIIQKRVAGGGYAGDGASTIDELDFTKENLNNKEKGASGAEVMIHELVHQWWGLGNMFDYGEGDFWSSEGLTVYTTYRIVKELYGEQYARENYINMWKEEVENYYNNFYVRNPKYLDKLSEFQRANITNSLSSVKQYSEMPLKILKAEKLLGGEKNFDEVLSKIFQRKIDYEYPYLTYDEFLNYCGLEEEELNLYENI